MPWGTYLVVNFIERSLLLIDLDLPVGEAEPLEQEPPGVLHALVVAAPVLQPVITEGLHDLQPLLATNYKIQFVKSVNINVIPT